MRLNKKDKLEEEEALFYFCELVVVLCYLHSIGVLHRYVWAVYMCVWCDAICLCVCLMFLSVQVYMIWYKYCTMYTLFSEYEVFIALCICYIYMDIVRPYMYMIYDRVYTTCSYLYKWAVTDLSAVYGV